MFKFDECMLDIETLGTSSNSPIASIAGVLFNSKSGEIGPTFYRIIELQSSIKITPNIDGKTIAWWMKQSEKPRSIFNDPTALPIESVLMGFKSFLERRTDKKNLKMWGNGPTFDCGITRDAYEALDIQIPWLHYNERCVRTIVNAGRLLGIDPKYDLPFKGEKHNALADAKHQAIYTSAIMQKILNTKAAA